MASNKLIILYDNIISAILVLGFIILDDYREVNDKNVVPKFN